MTTPESPEPPRYAEAFQSADDAFDRLDAPLWRPISDATVAVADPRPGERVLDACCGNGASALPTAHRVGPTGDVHGVDLSARQIRTARERAATGHLSWARFTVADATELLDAGPGYDLVQCVLGIFFFSDLAAGTERLITQARPSGRVALTIWHRAAIEPIGRHLLTELLPFKPHLADWAKAQDDAPITRINTAAAYTRWLEDRGLDQAQVHLQPHALDLTPELAWDLVIGSGFRALLDGLTPTQVAKVRQAYLQQLADRHVEDLDATTLVGTGRRSP